MIASIPINPLSFFDFLTVLNVAYCSVFDFTAICGLNSVIVRRCLTEETFISHFRYSG